VRVAVEEVTRERETVGVRDNERVCPEFEGLRLDAEDLVAEPVADLVLLATPERLIVLEREAVLLRVAAAANDLDCVTDLLRVAVAELMRVLGREIERFRVLVEDEEACLLVE
jgi:hypothetical protein